MSSPQITILIPTRFDSKPIIELCLATIKKYTLIPHKIIVGDTGVDQNTKDFLLNQNNISVVECPDPIRPKDFLARQVTTPFFIFLHDDIQILKENWLHKRLLIMQNNRHIGAMGVLSTNYTYGWQRFFTLSSLQKRFFPLGLMIKKETQDELDLFWGKIKGFDTGGIAYQQFVKQKKWRLKRYPFHHDIRHWGGLTWVIRKKIQNETEGLNLDNFIESRDQKMNLIKKILYDKKF